MKKNALLLLAIVFILSACSDTKSEKEKEEETETGKKKTPATDDDDDVQSDPADVVKLLFKAAKSGDYSGLSNLCGQGGDGDMKDICDLENQPAEKQEEFQSYFSKGKVVGDAEIEGNEARVKIKFGPDGNDDETMVLMKKNNKWYLSSF